LPYKAEKENQLSYSLEKENERKFLLEKDAIQRGVGFFAVGGNPGGKNPNN